MKSKLWYYRFSLYRMYLFTVWKPHLIFRLFYSFGFTLTFLYTEVYRTDM